MLLVVVTGPPGAGKSSVATQMHDRLGADGVVNAMIELDELERCYPPLPTAVVLDHLAMLAKSYRRAGYDFLLVTATVEDDDYGRDLAAAIEAETQVVIRLTAEPSTLRKRVIARESPTWDGLPELLESAERLAQTMSELTGVDLVASTDGRDPDAVAVQLLADLAAFRRSRDERCAHLPLRS